MRTTFVHSERLRTAMPQRRGTVVLLTAISLGVIFGFVVLGVETGFIYLNRGQLQTCADAGALAGASALQNDKSVLLEQTFWYGQWKARSEAVHFASANRAGINFPSVNYNFWNDPDGDVVIGYLAHPEDPKSPLDFSNPLLYNAVQVRVRKTAEKNGVVPAFFSRIWGNEGTAVVAKATAITSNSIIGFRTKSERGDWNTSLMPFAVSVDNWNALLAGAGDDKYGRDSDGKVTNGSDGILELDMFPSSDDQHGGLTPGNFGTVDIGEEDNSTQDLNRQIEFGVSEEDLSHHDGKLVLGPDGTLELDGDTGVSAGIKDSLERIKGKPRSILLYEKVEHPGDNATYTIVGFAGVRVMKVHLTGSMSMKSVVVQPAVVFDGNAVIGNSPNQSNYLYSTARLVR